MDSTPVSPTAAALRTHRGLRFRIVLLMAACASLVAFILVLVFAVQMRSLLLDETRKRGEAIAQELGDNLFYELSINDQQKLGKSADAALQLPDVAYVVMRNAKGESLLEKHAERLKGFGVDAIPAQAGALDLNVSTKARSGASFTVGSISVQPIIAPVFLYKQAGGEDLGMMPGEGADDGDKAAEGSKELVGSVLVGVDLSSVRSNIVAVTVRAVLLGLAVLLLCVVLSWFVARLITVPLERLTRAASGIAGGNLQQNVEVAGQDEISQLAQSFQTMTVGLRAMIADLRAAAIDVDREAGEILSTSAQQSAMASQQASAVNETSTTVSEIAQTSQQATQHADSVIKLAQRSEELSRDGQRVVEESMAGLEKLAAQVKNIAHSITDLSERTRQIGDIIATVKDLAEQSNLLALNASIEAAKAGEHGRGFAVVAMEMHNLAEQSKVAAGQVRGILGEVQKGTRVAVAATEEGSKRAREAMGLAQGAGSSISGLAEVIRDSSIAARQIAANTRQQTIGVEQIVAAISELSAGISDALEGTKKVEKVASHLTTVSKRLTELVGRYQV